MEQFIDENMIIGRGLLLCFLVITLFFVMPVSAVGAGELDLTGFSIHTGDAVAGGFDLNSLLIKVSVKEGDSVKKVLSINRGGGQQISLSTINLEGVNLSENEFVLGTDETKNVEVVFDASKVKAGINVGSIKINDEKETFYLPVIFEVETKDLFYDANLEIPPQYSQISPGDKLVAQMKIFDLTSGGTTDGLGANNIKVEYYVYGIDGSIISSESESLVVDRQTQVTKTVIFPDTVKEGNYVFTVLVKYGSSVGISSYMFSVIGKPSKNIFGGDFDYKFLSIILLVLVLFFGTIFFFVYLVKDRDKLILELRGYNNGELNRQRDILAEQAKILEKKNKTPAVNINLQIQKKIRELKVKQEKRVKHIQHLRKTGNVDEMKKMMNQWKKEGYNTLPMEYKLKGLTEAEMKKVLNKWKGRYSSNEGYKNTH